MTLALSIITPTLNRLAMLREAVDSVRSQGLKPLEHIIVDGGSDDGSIAWVRAQPDLTLITGADRGVYDALNIGIAAARGEIMGLLNSDDRYLGGAFAAAADAFTRVPGARLVTGAADIIEDGRVIATHHEQLEGYEGMRSAFLGICLPNACFYRRELFDRIGFFNPEWKLISDRDLFLRIIAVGLPSVGLHQTVYAYRRHAASLTFDPGRGGAVALRQELLEMALAWQSSPDAQMRCLARILEGRSRIGLVRDGLRFLSGKALASAVASSGRPLAAPASVILALADRMSGGIACRRAA